MLNKKGQTLILFVIMIPIILGIAALVIDVGVIFANKSHLKEVTKTAIRENISNIDNNTDTKIKNILIKNEVNVDNLEIKISDNKINVKNEISIDSIFGSIIGIKNYKIIEDITGYKENEKIVIE